jgi:molybdopterin converting factor small subunit
MSHHFCRLLPVEAFMNDSSLIEIKIVAGSNFKLLKDASEQKHIPSHLQLSVPDNSNVYTLRELLLNLSTYYEQIHELILDRKSGRIKGNVSFILNETHIDLLSGLDTQIRPGDQLFIFPYLAGG